MNKIIIKTILISLFFFSFLEASVREYADNTKKEATNWGNDKVEEGKQVITNKMDEIVERKTNELEDRINQKEQDIYKKIHSKTGSKNDKEVDDLLNKMKKDNAGSFSLIKNDFERIKNDRKIKEISNKMNSILNKKHELDIETLVEKNKIKELTKYKKRIQKKKILLKLEKLYFNNNVVNTIYKNTPVYLTPLELKTISSIEK